MAEELAFPTPAANQQTLQQPQSPSGLRSFSPLAAAASFGLGLVSALFKPQRALGTIIARVTVDEVCRDDLEITRHPVETGASITDHAYKLPAEIIVRCGWTNSGFGPGYVEAVYAALLALQASRVPFTVVTGKRMYPNMLIASIGQTTDAASEGALMCQVTCRQVILVETQVTTVAPREQQAIPATTAPVEPAGDRQPAPVNNDSIFKSVGDMVRGGLQGLSNIGGSLGPAAPAGGA